MYENRKKESKTQRRDRYLCSKLQQKTYHWCPVPRGYACNGGHTIKEAEKQFRMTQSEVAGVEDVLCVKATIYLR